MQSSFALIKELIKIIKMGVVMAGPSKTFTQEELKRFDLAIADGTTMNVYYPEGIAWDVALERQNLARLVEDSVTKYGDKPCIDFLGKKYSYKEFGDMVDRAAQGLVDMGVQKGDRVGLYMPNTPYYPVMFFAALKLGATIVNYSPLYDEAKLEQQIKDSGTTVMVTLDLKDFFDKARNLQKKGVLDKVVKCRMADVLPFWKSWAFWALKGGDRTRDRAGQTENVFDFRDIASNGVYYGATTVQAEKDIAVLQYTGGTTGVPKGAMLTHFNLLSNAAQIEAFFGYTEQKDKSGIYLEPGNEKILAALPYFHVFGMMVGMINGLKMGSEIIMLPNPRDMKEVLETIDSKKPTILPTVPKLLQGMTEFKGMEKYDLTSLRGAVSGGAALPEGVRKAFEKATKRPGIIKQGYGLTETSPVAASNPPAGKNKPESVGIAYPGTKIRIADSEDPNKTLKIGETGEILIAGPQLMAGYYNRPEETAEVLVDIDGEKWLRTGDIGFMDEDRYVHIVDRKKRMIIINGYNVYPNVIENAFSTHPDVAESVVIKVSDERSGEAAKAFVRLKEGVSLSEEKLRDYLKSKLGRLEMPKMIEFVKEELPKTDVGKPDWKKLQDEEKAKPASSVKRPNGPSPK
jgi:long-chain acyl-CoA synthetase